MLLCTAILIAPRGDATELKPSYPLHDASGGEFQARIWQHWRFSTPQGMTSAQDRDLHNIAILEDDGTLVSRDPGSQLLFTNSGTIAARFYASHGDDFDFITIFVASTYPEDVSPEGGFAFQVNVANAVEGIGLSSFNNGPQIAPSVFRLRSLLNMNDLGEYPEDPGEEMPAFLNTFSAIDILGQEAGHMVGAFVRANNVDILGRGNNHWSFFFETYGSVLEGNGWRDNGDGTWTTVASSVGFSQLDLYLWGLLLPEQVTDPMYVLRFPRPDLTGTQQGDASLPVEGVTVSTSQRVDVTIGNITQVHGSRQPSAASSQKTFSMAWILVIPPGTEPAPHDIEKIDEFRTRWEEVFFPAETNGVGSMVSRLGTAPIHGDFEARVFAGAPGITVAFDNDSFGNIDAFEWDFGDGETSNERHPIHTYNEPGAYTSRLTLQGEGGPVVVEKLAFVQVGNEVVWFEDDFETDTGWEREITDTALTGRWERTPPIPSRLAGQFGNDLVQADVQPGEDHTPAGVTCLVTGNSAPSAGVGTADVDG
jgi:PKD repeat protein